MHPEVEPWLRQAEADLRAAKDSLDSHHYEWVCFQTQQAGERALKAFLLERGLYWVQIRRIGHSLYGAGSALDACQNLEPEFSSLNQAALLLDGYSVATRYPNEETNISAQAPTDFYNEHHAQSAIEAAESVLNLVRTYLVD